MVNFGLVQLGCIIQQMEKVYNEVENNRPPMHANILCCTRYCTMQTLSNKQSAKMICRFDSLEKHTGRDKKPYERWKAYSPPTHLVT